MSRIIAKLTVAATLAFPVTQLHAAPVFNTAEDILPGGIGTLQAERSVWASAYGGTLSTEGFESLVAAPPNVFDFGDFTLSLTGSNFTLFGANSLVRTEGTQGLGFSGSATVALAFDNPITAFGIDWSSFDSTSTVISYSDDAGGSVPDVFLPVTTAGAGFFGVRNADGFSTLSFSVTSNEILEFDFIQYGSDGIGSVPEPATTVLLGLGLAGMGYMRKRKNT